MPDAMYTGACANTASPRPPTPTVQDAISELEDSLNPLKEKIDLLEVKLSGFIDSPGDDLKACAQATGAPLVRRITEARFRIQDFTMRINALLSNVQIA